VEKGILIWGWQQAMRDIFLTKDKVPLPPKKAIKFVLP